MILNTGLLRMNQATPFGYNISQLLAIQALFLRIPSTMSVL
jgi:hypothetical protein